MPVSCLQSSLLSFLSWFCSSFSIIPSSLLRPLPSFLGCFERPMFIFSENSLWKLSGNSSHPKILVLGLPPGMPNDTRRSPCPPDSPAVGFLPLCHSLFPEVSCLSCLCVTRLLLQASKVSGQSSEAPLADLMPESFPAPTVHLACHL